MDIDHVKPKSVNNISDDLFQYAIDRTEMKWVLKSLPDLNKKNLTLLEYELQILKILFVGWGISFFMLKEHDKQLILQLFWNKIKNFSIQISSSVSLASKKDINYFDILKNRNDTYLSTIESFSSRKESELVGIVGKIFAKVCKLDDDACTILAGSKLFNLSINSVKEYLV